MIRRIFVTGASGFVGNAVVRELLARGYHVNALVNRHPVTGFDDRVVSIPGGMFDVTALDKALAGCVAAIHLVGIIMEKPGHGVTFERVHVDGTLNVVSAAQRAGVKRYIHMSALGARPGAVSSYHESKFHAEQIVRQSRLDWTIIRPSMIHGPRGDFMRQEAGWARGRRMPFLFMPYFGSGFLGHGHTGQLQPVHVDDVARAVLDAMENPHHVGEVYLLGGPDRMTWPELHRVCAGAIIGRTRWVMPMPAWKARFLASFLPASLLQFNMDMVQMSLEDNTCDLAKFREKFGWEPRPFEPSLREYAASL